MTMRDETKLMAKTRAQVIRAVRQYAEELQRLGVPVERILLYGSYRPGAAAPDSDVDLAVFSEAFGAPDYREFSGVLSEAKWKTEPMIEAVGFHPSVLEHVEPISFLHEIVSTGEAVYHRKNS
jgi:predicted nucleotidyltransferase